MKKIALAVTVLAIFCAAAFAANTYTVTARVVNGSGAIQAELQPVDFTIPAGTTGTVTAFYATNPETGWESKKLGNNIYCVTQGRDWVDGNGNPIYQLPPGTYRFHVGGHPGAWGKLTYQVQ